MALEAIGSNPITHPIYFYVLGCSQVGKAPDFDSGISLVRVQPAQPFIFKNLIRAISSVGRALDF